MIRRLLAALMLAALLAGCASTEGSPDDDPPSGSNADPSDSASSDEPEGDDDAEDAPIAFGQAFTYDDGLTVKVSKPAEFKPSASAAATKGPAVTFTVTVVNKTGKTFDAALFYITMQAGNTEATEIYDSQKGINGSPMTKVLDGREATWPIAFNVKDPNDLVMEVSPDAGIEYAPVIYTS